MSLKETIGSIGSEADEWIDTLGFLDESSVVFFLKTAAPPNAEEGLKALLQPLDALRGADLEFRRNGRLWAFAGEPRPGSGIFRHLGGQPAGPLGTLGCFLESKDSNDPYFLAAAHVITNYGDSIDENVIFRDSSSSTGTGAQLRLGRSVKVQLPSVSQKYLDVAVCLCEKSSVKPETTCFGKFGLPLTTAEIKALGEGTAVKKCGAREPHRTEGKVIDTNYPAKISFGALGEIELLGQILITVKSGSPPFSRPGDSGSVVVVSSSNRPLGMLIAGDERAGRYVLNPIDRIQAELEKEGYYFAFG